MTGRHHRLTYGSRFTCSFAYCLLMALRLCAAFWGGLLPAMQRKGGTVVLFLCTNTGSSEKLAAQGFTGSGFRFQDLGLDQMVKGPRHMRRALP